jgi:hypothetical protein
VYRKFLYYHVAGSVSSKQVLYGISSCSFNTISERKEKNSKFLTLRNALSVNVVTAGVAAIQSVQFILFLSTAA